MFASQLSYFNRIPFNRIVLPYYDFEGDNFVVARMVVSITVICYKREAELVQVLRGDNPLVYFYLRNENNNQPILLRDVEIYFSVKKTLSDLNSKMVIDKSTRGGGVEIINDEDGLIAIVFSSDDTDVTEGTYKYDIRVVKGKNVIHSTLPQDFSVVPAVRKLPL